MKEISPNDLKTRLDAGEKLMIIDVREDWEHETADIEGSVLIPMNDIPSSLAKIPKDDPVVVMCHTGNRSGRVVMWLESQGYTNLMNLVGGINRWSLEIDPDVPRY